MAGAAGCRVPTTSMTGLKGTRWISDLTGELGEDFTEFVSHIGFSEAQVQLIQDTGQHIHRLVMEKWLATIGRHTTKYAHVIYTALLTLKRHDLMDKHFRGGTPDKYSVGLWEDFLTELHAVDFTNPETKEQDKPDVKKKKKKNNKRTKKKGEVDIERKTEVKEKNNKNEILADDAKMPDNPGKLSSAESKQQEQPPTQDNVSFDDNNTMAGNVETSPFTDKIPDVKKKKKKTSKRTKTKSEVDIEQSTVIKEKDNDNESLADDATQPDNPGIFPSTDSKQQKLPPTKDNVTVTGNVGTPPFTDSKPQESFSAKGNTTFDGITCTTMAGNVNTPLFSASHQHPVFIERQDGPLIVGDNATVIYGNTGSADEGDESIRKKLYDIMQTKGAVGSDAKKNKINLQTLESCFKQRNGKHFESVYGKALLTFLHQATEFFALTKHGGQWFVHMIDHPNNTPQKCSQTQETNEGSKVNRKKSSAKSSNKRSTKAEAATTSNNQTFSRPTHDHTKSRAHVPNKCTQFGDFLDFVRHFSDGNYLLMISKTDFIKHEEALTNIPWFCVFDFDVDSFTEGLFFRIDDLLRAHRGAVYPCTWKDPPNVQHFGTEWCFISGSNHSPGSNTPESFKMWYTHIQSDFERHIKDITKLLDTVKPLTVVAFLPENQDTGKKFHKIISVLNESIRPLPQVVVIADNPTAENKFLIGLIEPNYTLEEKLENVFHDLSTNVRQRAKSEHLTYMLPTASGDSATRIDNTLAASFRESMQILYLDNPFQSDLTCMFATEEEESLFFKGGTLSWEAYYKNGPEHFYIARDCLPAIVKNIRTDFIECSKQGEITIYHAPGAGGTTLGQNIIWDLHTITPCVQVRSDTLASPKQTADHITTLYNETHLPIVVLFDGSNDKTFDNIRGKLNDICVIFIHLKRVSAIKPRKLRKHEYFLEGALSSNEAKRMGPKFTRCCGNDIEKKDQIQKLVDDVVAGQKHHLIEFGLVTYLHEFTGVSGYVSAYLDLEQQSKELDKCRKVLGYMSLVQVFGQGIMPCQLFGTMLGKSPDYPFKYDMFPSIVKEFTVPVESDFTRNSVRICHYLIAKEILDQLLSRKPSIEKSQDLSMLAKQNLKSFVLEFIEDLKIRQDQLGQKSRTVFDIILQTFIYREDRSTQNQQGKYRSQLSQLLESIPSEQPFTERLEVMETLAESFPGNPSLWAHLGRAYVLLRPNEKETTEIYFQNAITGCRAEQNLTNKENDENDNVLSYVLHMYGIFYLKQIRAEIAHCNSSSEMEFQQTVRNIFKLAVTACESFEDCRRLRFAGSQESFGCTGEIDVRLAICEFLKRHYRFATISALLEISKNSEISTYVEKSLSLVQQLFMQCYNVVDQSQIDDDFYRRITLYNTLFRGMIPNSYMDLIQVPDSVHTRGVVIAAIKLKYGADNKLGTASDITEDTDIKRMILLLETNFDDIRKTGVFHSKTGTDHAFLDWIHVIRLAKQRHLYTVEDVLVRVRYWFDLVRSPYSRLYLFILLFVYTINLDGPCEKDILKEAIALKEDIEWIPGAKSLSNPERPREWLGKESGIRCLVPGKSFKSDEWVKCIDDEVARYNLIVLKGSIRPPNTYRIDGYIDMDVEGNTNIPVKVRFCPIRTKDKLVGAAYAGRRVEFVLAFTALSGFEAYNVVQLQKSTCKNCKSKVEITSVEKCRNCKCGESVENAFPIQN